MKANILYKISLALSCVSAAILVAAMIFSAIRGDRSRIVALVAIASAVISLAGIILACLSTKIGNDKNETDKN